MKLVSLVLYSPDILALKCVAVSSSAYRMADQGTLGRLKLAGCIMCNEQGCVIAERTLAADQPDWMSSVLILGVLCREWCLGRGWIAAKPEYAGHSVGDAGAACVPSSTVGCLHAIGEAALRMHNSVRVMHGL